MRDSKYDIFISYRREDGAEFSEGLANQLKSDGYRVFFDKGSIGEGKDFPSVIRDALNESVEFVSVITTSYFGPNKNGETRIQNENDWVRQEIQTALSFDNMHFHPILIKCDAPPNNQLPKEIQKFADKNFLPYNSTYDTYEKVADKLISEFHEQTVENAIIGKIITALNEIDVNDNEKFNEVCKKIIGLIDKTRGVEPLYHILDYKKEGSSRHYYKKDYRFSVFYVLFTYYRRNHENLKLIEFVEERKDEFKEGYSFMNYVMTEYNHKKFELAKSEAEEQRFLKEALKFARKGIEQNPSNSGILHSFSVAVALAIENGVTVEPDEVTKAIETVNCVISEKPDYGGIYYATKARLLCASGNFDDALKNIRYAQALEKPDHDDWILRIANYQRYEFMIQMKRESNSEDNES